ncbi:MAG: prenyltransferase/squalene oxidase repeat-containing protein [Promethearchaeota archaeon]
MPNSYNDSESEITDVYPYISRYKKEQWYPFSITKMIPDYYIPDHKKILDYYRAVTYNLMKIRGLNIENIYWYLIMGKYLGINFLQLPIRNEIVDFIKKCETWDGDLLGFKFSPYSTQKNADIWSTAFALASLKILGQLKTYFASNYEASTKNAIKKFIFSCKRKKKFLHCRKNCDICRKTSEFRTLYSVLEALLILDEKSINYNNEIIPMLKEAKYENNPKNLFRLLCMKFFNLSDVSPKELVYFLNFQKADGGFNLKNVNISNLNETFWISYLFENYKSLSSYPRGNIFSYIVQNLKYINVQKEAMDPLKIMEYAKLIVLLAIVWNNLIDGLEELIFKTFTESSIMDINILSEQAGIKNAEYEIIAFINLKYNIKLDIVDNAMRFNQYSSKLMQIEKYFASILYRFAKQYTRIDLSEIASKYNKGKPKSARVPVQLLIDLVNDMMEQHFFRGTITEKKRLFRKYYYFDRDLFIPKVVKCDRVINIEDIKAEKNRIIKLRNDIYNMTLEMKSSASNIMQEVDTLILANEVELAEKRLKNNIKKALFDAEFFNKTIQQSIKSFEYIKIEEQIKDVLKEWENVFKNLQSDFDNVNKIMSEKIKHCQQVMQQDDMLKQLEDMISEYIADLSLSFSMFQESMSKKLEIKYSKENIESIEEELSNLMDKIKQYDWNIVDQAQLITIDESKIRKKRKKIINLWISKKEDFDSLYMYYLEGFKLWHRMVDKIEDYYNKYISQVNELENSIENAVVDKKFDKAFEIIDSGFPQILKDIADEFDSIKKEINSVLKKNRKLYLLYKNLEDELESRKKQLESDIQHIRENLRTKVSIDKKRQIQEDFILLVNKQVDYLTDSLAALENQLLKMLAENQLPTTYTNEFIEQQFAKIDEIHLKTNETIKNKLKECENNIPNFRAIAEASIRKWNKFTTLFEPKIKEVKNRIIDEVIKKSLYNEIAKKNSNQIDLAKIAQNLSIDKRFLRSRVEYMLNISKIAGDIISGTCFFIVHDEEWRKNKRIKLFIDGELNQLKKIVDRLTQLYETSLLNSTFTKNIQEFIEIEQMFKNKKETIDIKINQKINELRPNKNNEMFVQNMTYYQNKIKEFTKQVDDILIKANKSVEFAKFTAQQLEIIENMISLKMKNLRQQIESRKNFTFKKNKEWLTQELSKIDSEIKRQQSEFQSKMNRMWSGIHAADQLKGDLFKEFQSKINKIINNYKILKEDMEQTIINFEYARIQNQLNKVLYSKQHELNNFLGKMQADIDNKIEFNDFKSALTKLSNKKKQAEELIKKVEKDLKQKNKKITKNSPIFAVKGKYLLDRWNKFKEEYETVLNLKIESIRLNIIEKYTKLLVKVFKDQYVSIDYIAKYFDMKQSEAEQAIIKLCGDDRLPGNVEQNLHIYYENPQIIEKLTGKEILLEKESSIKKFLRKQKALRIFIDLIPIISGILTIIVSIIRLAYALPIPWYLILLFGILILGLFMSRMYRKIKKSAQEEDNN